MGKGIESKRHEYLRLEARRLREEADALPSGQARNELLQQATRLELLAKIEQAGVFTGAHHSVEE